MTTATPESIRRVAEAAWAYRDGKEASTRIAVASRANPVTECPGCGGPMSLTSIRCMRCYKARGKK